MSEPLRIIVLEGDETGQELLEQALRVLDPEVLKVELELEHFDLSLENRRRTSNEVVSEAAAAMNEARFGLKAATITPEGKDDVGSPNRLLREAIDGKVIIRTGRRIPGVTPVAGVHYPIAVVRMATPTARTSAASSRTATRWPTGRRRSRATSAAPWPSTASAPPRASTAGCTAAPSGP
jgi:isocitrate dehydrogenase